MSFEWTAETNNIILNTKPEGRRIIERPKLRWEDGVDNDIKPLGERNWVNTANNR
jgi:hypothetical protein